MKDLYDDAKQFLLKNIPSSERAEILGSYLQFPDQSNDPVGISKLFERLLSSAQNANMKAGVVGKSIGGVKNLGKVLYDFNPNKTLKSYRNEPDKLMADIEKKLKPSGKIRKEPRSIWPKYCETILSAAAFFDGFESQEDFYEWAQLLYNNKKTLSALPLILAAEIDGIGYPLACDFLKELGFINYGKPDIHVIDIFVGIKICRPKPSPYKVQKMITRIADAADVSPYDVDKVFWLIGSGKFYHHKTLGNNGRIGSLKKAYIAHANAPRKPGTRNKRSE